MCTILTVSSAFYSRGLERRILEDAKGNGHGFALLLTDEKGALLSLRSMDIEPILALIRSVPWERLFLHSRWATQGQISLTNTHGWQSDSVFYFHNGCLTSKDAYNWPVDSQAIGQWVSEGGVAGALEKLKSEAFANVFLVDADKGYYSVSRGTGGSLYTDGNGNYSTNPFDAIKKKVENKSDACYFFSEYLYNRDEEKAAAHEAWKDELPAADWKEMLDFYDMDEEEFLEMKDHEIADYISWWEDEMETARDLGGPHATRGLWDSADGDYNIDADGIGDYTPRSLRRKA